MISIRLFWGSSRALEAVQADSNLPMNSVGMTTAPYPRLSVQGHTLSTCGDLCLSILSRRCVLQVVTLDFMMSLCLQFWPVVAVVCLQISSAVNHHFEPPIQFQSVDIGTVGEGNSKIDGYRDLDCANQCLGMPMRWKIWANIVSTY